MTRLALPAPPLRIDYGPDIEAEIAGLGKYLAGQPALAGLGDARWLAARLLEADPAVTARLAALPGTAELIDRAQAAARRLEAALGEEVDTLIADGRYGWIHALVAETVRQPDISQVSLSDRIDGLVTHRLLGLPIFLGAMWAVFMLTTTVSAPFLEAIAALFEGPVTQGLLLALAWAGLADTWLASLLVDGVVAGVGGVLVFVPVLLALYFALAILEDSGYMARAAFVMDRFMRGFGLHGKSFLPMLVGFGCTVPAIYATRTLRDERDRVLTGLLVPFMSCGARLPVYVLFAAVFFPRQAGTVVFAMYLVGILTAILLALLLRHTVFRGSPELPFVLELPPYRLPTAGALFRQMASRTAGFIRKAWSIILVMSVILWFLMAIPAGRGSFADTAVDDSLFASLAGTIAPLFAPLGFDSWQASGALMTGLVAKEVVVSTLSQIYAPAAGGAELGEASSAAPPGMASALWADFARSSGGHPAAAGLAFMVFVLLYTPCMVAVAAAGHEFGRRWMWTSVLGQFAVAWLVALAVFQVAKFWLG